MDHDHPLSRSGPAEWARTLAAGSVPARLLIAGAGHARQGNGPSPGPEPAHPAAGLQVRHAADPHGALFLLIRPGTAPDLHLRRRGQPADGMDVLDVLDVPPGRWCLPRARLCVSGWVEPLTAEEQRRVADTVAGNRPRLPDGHQPRYRFEVADIRLVTATGVHSVDPASYAATEPDPLYPDEDRLAIYLERHHRDELASCAGADVAGLDTVCVTGLDRYGIDLLCTAGSGYRALRLPFAEPVRAAAGLGRQLRLLLHPPRPAEAGARPYVDAAR